MSLLSSWCRICLFGGGNFQRRWEGRLISLFSALSIVLRRLWGSGSSGCSVSTDGNGVSSTSTSGYFALFVYCIWSSSAGTQSILSNIMFIYYCFVLLSVLHSYRASPFEIFLLMLALVDESLGLWCYPDWWFSVVRFWFSFSSFLSLFHLLPTFRL